MERWSTCPTCKRPVRLSESELEAKRGFCARCDAEFEISRGAVWDGAPPFRSQETVELVPIQSAPPTRLIRADSERIIIDSGYRRTLWFGIASFTVGVPLQLWFLGLSTIIWPALLFFMSLPLAVHHLRREVLELRDDALWYRSSFRGWQRVSLHDLRALEVEAEGSNHHRLRIQYAGGKQILLGNGHGHDKEAMLWIQRWLEDRIRAVLANDVPALPPVATKP